MSVKSKTSGSNVTKIFVPTNLDKASDSKRFVSLRFRPAEVVSTSKIYAKQGFVTS